MWQDYIIGIGAFIFVIALIPSIIGPNKPDIKTAIPTSIVLYSFVVSYISMGLWLAATTTAGTAIEWTILSVQQIIKLRKRRNKI
jgi:hypothetical protein